MVLEKSATAYVIDIESTQNTAAAIALAAFASILILF
jgi:hypothetical protein